MGGSWERVQDVFPLFAGTTYAAGSTGGEENVTLTVDKIPAHGHQLNYYNADGAPPSGSYWVPAAARNAEYNVEGGNTLNTGGGQPHNNMPPYRTFYCWERVA